MAQGCAAGVSDRQADQIGMIEFIIRQTRKQYLKDKPDGSVPRLPPLLYAGMLLDGGIIVGTTEDAGFVRIDAEVPLSEMFGYATVIRSATQGKAEFTMEFARYGTAPAEIAEELREKWLEKKAAGSN